MSYLPQLDYVVRAVGGGVPASILGQSYSLYRANSNTAGAVISSNSLVYPSFKMYFEKASKAHLENQTFDLQVFEASCNGLQLQIGDILVENGYKADRGQYCVAQLRPMKKPVLVRVESNSAIAEPQPEAGSDETQPTTGLVFVEGSYGGPTVAARYVLTLDGGLYQMVPFGQGTLASIPVGFQPLNRVKDAKKDGIPTPFPRTTYLAYIPPTPGYTPSELDVIKAQNTESYMIAQIFSSGLTGLQGTICICERMAT